MPDIILKAENISKQYRLGLVGTDTMRHDLKRWWHLVRGKEDPFLKISEVSYIITEGYLDWLEYKRILFLMCFKNYIGIK